jgi:type II secretion system protein C
MHHSQQIGTAATWLLLLLTAFFSADLVAVIAEKQFHPEGRQIPTFQPTPHSSPSPPVNEVTNLLGTTRNLPGGPGSVDDTPLLDQEKPPPFSLVGTLAGENGQGIAFIQIETETVTLGPGDLVPDSTALLVEVRPDHILVEHLTNQYVVSLGQTPSSPTKSATPNVQQTNDTSISQSEIRALLERTDLVFQPGFKIAPKIENGDMVGAVVKLPGKDHPLARLGLESGDLIKSINQKPLNETGSLAKMLPVLRNSSTLVIEIERRGQAKTLTIDLD